MSTDSGLVVYQIKDATVVTFQESSILDTLKIEQIGDALYDLVDTRACRKLILDFGKVQFLSSSALGVLVTLRRKADAIKGKLVICGIKDELKKAFTITRLDKLFEFKDSEKEALESLGIRTQT
ncbi:MAG: STAS domain-containing protein [Phycisphaerae bacterium]|nr:STAS domain-containing protein [Phycisphaerae bacterium]